MFLTVLFTFSGVTKALYYVDQAPSDVQTMTDAMFPSYIKTPLIAPVFASVKAFVLFISAFELLLALAFFFRPRLAALGVLAVMAGAEYCGWAVGNLARVPAHPLCGASPTCAATQGLHVVVAALAGLVYVQAAPLCRQVALGWASLCGNSGRAVRNTNNPYANKNRKKHL